MRVLFVQHSLKLGGGHAITSRLVEGMQADGHCADVFYFDDALGKPIAPVGATAFVGVVTDLLELVWNGRYDVVHAYSDGWDFGLDLVHLLCPATKLIINGQGVVNPGWTSQTCAALTVCAQWMADEHRHVTDLPTPVVLNAVDGARFPAYNGPIAGPPIVAWVGRVTDARKGIGRLAAAAPMLRASGVRLWLACPESRGTVQDDSVHTALERAAERWEAVPSAEMPAFYRDVAASGGCLVSTAHFEGLPLAILEAQSSGCPVIAIDAPGVNEAVAVRGGAIILSASTTGEELAQATLQALSDSTGMVARREACAVFTRAEFSPLVERDAFLHIYGEAPHSPIRPLPKRPGWKWSDSLRRSPAYITHRWANAEAKYRAGLELRRRRQENAAVRALREAFLDGPTLFVKPARLSHLLGLSWRPSVQTQRNDALSKRE